MKPREYQAFAVTSIFSYFKSGKTGNPVVACPTGTGKSIIIGEFIRQAFEQYPYTRIMKLTHSKELIEQNLNKLLAVWPTAPAGVYSAGLKRKESSFPITFGGIGSVAKQDLSKFGRIDLLLIDECHLVSPSESTQYRKVIEGLKKINPYLKVIGFTATHFRLGQGMLTDPGGLFTDVCFDATTLESFNWFVSEGFLAPLIPKRTKTELDVSGVHKSGGEYKQNELQDAVDIDNVTMAAVQEMIEFGEDRKCWLIFASGIEHTIHVNEMLNRLGVASTFVHSKMPSLARDANLLDFKAGKYRAIVNNGILTTGFDHPPVDLIGMLRPTQSSSLWCLSEDTEVLTPSGWKSYSEIEIGDPIMGFDQNSSLPVETLVTGYVHRELNLDEKLLHYKSRQFEFCQTNSHSFLYEQRIGNKKWDRRKTQLGSITGSCNRRVLVSASKQSVEVDVSMKNETLELLGLYLSDGSFDKSNNTLVFYQSERYPKVLNRIEELLILFGLTYRKKHTVPNLENGNFESSFKMWKFVISKTSRSDLGLGWGSLFNIEDLNKELSETFQKLTENQFESLLEGINLGDGSKYQSPSIYWKPATYSISTGRKKFADNLQRLAVLCGWSCRISSRISNNGNPLYIIHAKKRTTQTFKLEFLEDVSTGDARVWCVENPTGNIITRYKGHVLITGNCQMLGRGTRPNYAKGYDLDTTEGRLEAIANSSKQNCLVLDFAGNTKRLGPINDVVLPKSKGDKGGGTAPIKVCEACGVYNHASVRFCMNCGHEFPRQVKIVHSAGTDVLIAASASALPVTDTFKVDRVIYSRHDKVDRPPSIKISYYCGLRVFHGYLCLEHEGFAKKKSRDLWRERSDFPPPDTTAEAFEMLNGLKTPTHIRVWLKSGQTHKYDEILSYIYESETEHEPQDD